MCGIAGFSLQAESDLEPSVLTSILLAGIAERGDDACGYAYALDTVHVHKTRGGASRLIDRVAVPEEARAVLVHVREHTKGTPLLEANNHPIRHGAVVGVHNGTLTNDEQLFHQHHLPRAEQGMTVDSEAIFALLDTYPKRTAPTLLEEIEGTLATAWLDERRPGELGLARGVGRPLTLAESAEGVFFASTPFALELMSGWLGHALEIEELAEGSYRLLQSGAVASTARFQPRGVDLMRDYSPPAPAERERCLSLLGQILPDVSAA